MTADDLENPEPHGIPAQLVVAADAYQEQRETLLKVCRIYGSQTANAKRERLKLVRLARKLHNLERFAGRPIGTTREILGYTD